MLELLLLTIIGLLKLGLDIILFLTILFIFYKITGINLVKPVVKKYIKYVLN